VRGASSLLRHLGGGRGQRGAVTASGDGIKGAVWRFDGDRSGGAAVAAGIPEVRRRQGLWGRRWRWCRGSGLWSLKWRRHTLFFYFFHNVPITYGFDNGLVGPFILLAIHE
jgi:hypothetical protein